MRPPITNGEDMQTLADMKAFFVVAKEQSAMRGATKGVETAERCLLTRLMGGAQ